MKSQPSVRQSLNLFWRFTKKRKLFFWVGTSGAVIAIIVQDILSMIFISKAFTKLQYQSASGAALNLHDYTPYLFGYLACMVGGLVLWRAQVVFVWQYEVKGMRDIAVYIFNHLQQMGAKFHANRFGGALVSQTNKFLSAYERVTDEFTWSITTGLTAFLGSFIVLLINAPLFAAVFAAITFIFSVIAFWRVKKTMNYDRALASSESQRTAKLADMITNVSAVTSFAREKHEKQLFEKQANETTDHYFALLKKAFVNDAISHSMTNGIALIAFIAGVLAITVFNKPAGVLFLSVNYTLQMSRRLWESTRVMRNLNRAFGDASDMTAILQLEPEIKDTPNAKELSVPKGEINVKSIEFGYSESTEGPLFKNLNLLIKPGEKIGLVGHSGGGKTTFTKLLLRFADINKGSVTIDGQDITKVTQQSLRENIAYVPQEPLLFHRSLADNISYSQPSASLKKIEDVAKLANAHDFINKLPKKYETLVGERGVKLSGGQRQRVAIARAMLKNAPILVLDEATSSLDSESEKLIQDALWKLMEGRTAIVIAHRLSTVQKMDRIVVLEEGKIVEEGSHKELLAKNGVYAGLWAHQSGGFLEE